MSVSPKKQLGDILDLSLINARLFELLTWGTVVATLRTLFLLATFSLFIIIAIPVIFGALVIQREYPIITDDIANNALANEIVTIGINTIIELINASFRIVDFFIDVWDYLVGILYLTGEMLYHAIEDFLQVVFGTPKLQCVVADLVSLGANVFGQVMMGIKLVFDSTQRTLHFVDDIVPPPPAPGATRDENKRYAAYVVPELTELDVSRNKAHRVFHEANIPGLTAATFNHTHRQQFCSPQGGVNPDFDGGETTNEKNGQCPPNTKILTDILKVITVLIQIITDVLEFVIPVAIVFFKDVFHELTIVIPQFLTMISKIVNALKEKGVFTNVMDVVRSSMHEFAELWNSFCFVFAFVGWVICGILAFLAYLLNSFVGTLVCAFSGGTGANSALSAPALPPPIEASVFNSAPIGSDAEMSQYGRPYVLTLNRPSDANISQTYGFYFVPPSNRSFPQDERLNYAGIYTVPPTGTVYNRSARAAYANQQAYMHSATRAAVICGLLDRSCRDTTSLFRSTIPENSVGKYVMREDDTAAEAAVLSSSSSKCGVLSTSSYVYGAYENGTACTTCNFDPCNLQDNTANPYAPNCNCKQFCNPNIMTNSGLPDEGVFNPMASTSSITNFTCTNPSGRCERLPGQICPTSNYGFQVSGTCSGSDTGNNVPGPCYDAAHQAFVLDASIPYPPSKWVCSCEGSDECGGSSYDTGKAIRGCGVYSVKTNNLNMNGKPTCLAPRVLVNVQTYQCACLNHLSDFPCFFGGYACMNWSLSANLFNNASGPTPDVACISGDNIGPLEFLDNLFDCFEKDATQLLFGGDEDDGDNICGPPLNPSQPEDDGDLQQTTGVNFSVPGDTPANQFPKTGTGNLNFSQISGKPGTSQTAGYCPPGQQDDITCNYPPNTAPNGTFKCKTPSTSAAGGATNQADVSMTGVTKGGYGTRCKAILQMCTCLKPLANSTASTDPIFAAVKCEVQALEQLVVSLANNAKSVWNLVVSLLRALPQTIAAVLDYLGDLLLDTLTFLVDFAAQTGVIFITLENSGTLASGIVDSMKQLEKTDIWKQFANTTAGRTLTQLSTRKLSQNATCDPACLNGSKPNSGCLNTCPRTKCFLSGAPSLCCFPGPPPALFSGETTSGLNFTGSVDSVSGEPIENLLSDSHRFCILGTTDRDVDFSNVTLRYAKVSYHQPQTGIFTRGMLQQMIGLHAQKSLATFQNHIDLYDSITKLQAIANIMAGETQIYTPERDDVVGTKLRRNYGNREYQWTYDELGLRSQFGQILGGLTSGAVQARWQEYIKQREREKDADAAVNPDLSAASTADTTNLTCPTADSVPTLDAYCAKAGTFDPCCRCKTINGECRASPKSPYCCCHKNSTAYECCKGLPGCLYPIFTNFKIPRILNVDFLKYVNADTCAPFNTAPKQILFLLRFILGDFVHKFIAASQFETMKNFYQFFLGWLEFPDDNSLPAFALLCFLLNIGRLLAFLFIVFLAGILFIAFGPLFNELFDTFIADIEEAQTIATQEDEAAGGGNNAALLQQQLLGVGTSAATPS